MVKKNATRGKVVAKVNGYNVRIVLKSVTSERKDRNGKLIEKVTRMTNSGTFGVYAGKNLKKDGFKSVKEATAYAETL